MEAEEEEAQLLKRALGFAEGVGRGYYWVRIKKERQGNEL